MSYAAFEARIARINDIICTLNLLAWDSRTMMPPGGVDARGRQVATLTDLARDLATGDEMRRAMDGAREELAGASEADIRRLALAQAETEIGILSRIPASIISEMAGLKPRAHSAWVAARAADDFAGFAPLLERMMAMQREVSAAIGGGDHPYDPLVGMFEPGMTLAELRRVFDRLKAALVPLIERAKATPQPDTGFLTRPFPIAAQKKFGLMLAERMGYDMSRGRLDETVHPFEISFTRDDVRITSRFRETGCRAAFSRSGTRRGTACTSGASRPSSPAPSSPPTSSISSASPAPASACTNRSRGCGRTGWGGPNGSGSCISRSFATTSPSSSRAFPPGRSGAPSTVSILA